MSYTTFEKVKDIIQADTEKIKISEGTLAPGQSGEIAKSTILQLITDIDAKIDVELENGGFSASSYTNALSYIATRYVAYEIYRILYPRVSANEIPVSVSGWKKDADELLEKIGKNQSGNASFADWDGFV